MRSILCINDSINQRRGGSGSGCGRSSGSGDDNGGFWLSPTG